MADARLTPAEHRALALTGELTNLLNDIIGTGPTRPDDIAEVVTHVHVIQHMIMAQAAARAYPTMYRLLGDSWEHQPAAKDQEDDGE